MLVAAKKEEGEEEKMINATKMPPGYMCVKPNQRFLSFFLPMHIQS